MKAINTWCRLAILGWAALLVACQHAPSKPVPATLVVNSTHAGCLQQIQAIIERDLSQPVRLTNAAFAQSSQLAISPAELTDAQGRLAQGRVRGLPEAYELLKKQSSCEMIRRSTGAATELTSCSCNALK